MNNKEKKKQQLGIDPGTVAHTLRKNLLFHFVKQTNNNICFQCNMEIKIIDDLSIEHKIPWLDSENPIELFFNLDNIAFSHLSCNIKAARQTRVVKHPSFTAYKNGCRCNECKESNKLSKRKVRENLKNKQGR